MHNNKTRATTILPSLEISQTTSFSATMLMTSILKMSSPPIRIAGTVLAMISSVLSSA